MKEVLVIRRLRYAKDITIAENEAIKALNRGEATKEQQIAALKCIVEKLCMRDAEPTNVDNVNETYFHLGRQAVARAILQEIGVEPGVLKKLETQKKSRKDE